MRNYLSFNWNLGIASGELASNLILIFMSFSLILHFKNNKNLKVIAFALSGILSITIGWGIGSIFSGDGYGLSLISPITAFLMAFHYNAYNALWFIILFQFLGSSFGFGMYLVYKKFLFTPKQKIQNLNISEPNLQQTIIKSLLFQPILIVSMILLPVLDMTSYDTGLFLNSIILVIAISTILLLTKNINSIIFSPFFTFYKLMDLLLNKQLTKKQIYAFMIEMLIQICFLIFIITLDVTILKYRGAYY